VAYPGELFMRLLKVQYNDYTASKETEIQTGGKVHGKKIKELTMGNRQTDRQTDRRRGKQTD
jgi:hypothetical protein